MGVGWWDLSLGCGVFDFGCGVWGFGCGVWAVSHLHCSGV